MDGQTVRTALGTIQSNPSAEDAWQDLSDALLESGGDLDRADALSLLQAARERHQSRGESDAVARLLELSVRIAEGSAEESTLLLELATVFLEDLFSGKRAIQILEKAAESSGGDADITSKLEEVRTRAANYKTQAGTYLKEADNATDDDYRSAMLMRCAEVEVCFAEDPSYGKIVENLELSLRLDSSNLPATRLLEVIYRRQADWEGVVRVLERAADRAPDQAARAAAGIRLARLYLHHFDDQEKAASAYDRVLETDPSQADAMEFVTQYYSSQERWDQLVKVYERPLKGKKQDDPTMVGDMLQVAMLHWKMRNAAADAEPWFARIQALEPAHDGVLNFYREHKSALNDDAGLVQILRAAKDALGAGDERASALDDEIASKQDEQASAQRSIEKFKSALRDNPDDEEAREELKTLYKQTQGHNALVELLRQQLERTPEDDFEKRLSVMREIANVYRQYVKSETALVGVLNQIVHLDDKLDEHDVGEVRELVSLYEKLSRPRDLLASMKLLAEIVPDKAEKISIYRQVGRRWLDQFSNVQHAMESFAALHELAPEDAEAIERLEDLYRKRRAWKELFDLYDEQLARASGDARVPLLREMAQLAAERLSRVDDALGYYREVLELDPTRLEVLDQMEKHAERSKNWVTLAEVLERRLAGMPEDETRLPVLQKLGGVYAEHLDKPEEAIGTWRRVVEVQPGHPRAMRVLRDTFLKASRFDDLEELYTSQKDLEGLAEVLSTAADRNKDPAEKLDLSYRAARVYEEALGQSARAIRSYERILSIEPKDARAIERLLPLYEQEEKWARIPPLLEVLVEVAPSADAKVEVYEKLIDLAGGKLADKKGAVEYARRAFEEAPENSRALELLDSTTRASGAWDEMVTSLESRLKSLGSIPPPPPVAEESASPQKKKRGKRRRGKKGASTPPEEAAEASSSAPPSPLPIVENAAQRAIALRLARVLGEELGRIDEAVARLKALAGKNPTDPEVMMALDALMRRESRAEDLRWLYDHRQTHAESDVERAEILCEWAAYEEVTVQDLAAAFKRYDQALAAQGDHVVALDAVARLALAQNQPERAAEVLRQHRDLLSGDEAAHKDAMLADLYADRLNQPHKALEAAQRALDGGAEPGVVIPVLQRLVEVPEVRGEAARILSEQYEAGGDSRQEADAVRALISETTEAGEQIELYKKLADIYEGKLNEPGAALSVMIDALSHHPTDMDLWDRAGPLAGAAGRPTDLSEAYRIAIRKDLPSELSLELSRRAAELHEVTLGDPQGSVPYYEKILALDADDETAFSRLKEILTAGERWRELEELYDSEIQRLDDEARRIEMLAEVALLAEDIMGDAERAIGYHKRILELDPETTVSLQSLDRLYTRLERKEDLLEILQKRASQSVGEEHHTHLVRLAQTALSLHVPEQAIAAIETVLQEDPNNYEARDIAEELLQIGRVRVRAALALETVYESKDEIRDLVRVLGVRVEALRPREDEELDEDEVQRREDDRRDLLRRIATLRDDRLHDDEGSFDVFAELSPLDPIDGDLRERLIDSGRRLGRAAKVVEVLLAAARAADTPGLTAEILLQAAPVQSDLLDDPEGAEETLTQVIKLRDDEPELALVAARSLESILVQKGRNQDLALNLKMQIELESEMTRKSELLARLAHLASDVLGDSQAAITAWEERLSDNPDDAESLRNLTELYEKVERYEDVSRVLEQRREATMDEKERSRLARHLADVQERHLNNPARAIESYQSILDETGPTTEVLAALVRLYDKAERWEELADVYERQADTLEDEVERLAALAHLGRLRSERLEDVPGALEAYRRALAVDMAHEPSRVALAELLDHEDDQARLEAAEILHPIYEADGAHENLLRVVEVEARASDDPSFRAARYETAVRIAEDSLGDTRRALQFALLGTKEAVAGGELTTWLSTLERLAGAANGRAEQVKVLQAIVTEIFDVEQQVRVQKRIAEIKRTDLGDRDGAIAAYRQALEFQAGEHVSLMALEELFFEAEEWQDLLGVLEQRVEAAEGDSTRKDLSFRKAKLLEGKLDDLDGAIETYEQILDIELDPRAISALERLYDKSERYEDLISLIQRRIDEGDGNVADLRVQLAAVCAEKVGDVERGLDELESALTDDTQHQGAVALLEKLKDSLDDPIHKARVASLLEPVYMVRADYDKVLSALSLRLDASELPDERRELVTRIAQIHEEQKEDYLAALEITALLLADDPADILTLEEMERLAKVAGAPLRLAELLSAQVATVQDDDDATAALCRRAGEILAEHGKSEQALALLKRALAFEPDSVELFEGVDALLQKVGSAEERVQHYRDALEHRFDPEDQQKLLLVIAELEEGKLGNVDAAIEAHRRAVEGDETNEASLDALTRLYRKTESWAELTELYERRAEMAGPIEGAQYRIALSDLHMRKLGNHQDSLDQLEEIVRDQPDHAGAIERLEAMRGSDELKARVVDILRPIYQAQDDWRRLIQLNEDRFVLADDPMDQVAILRETAEFWELRGDNLHRAQRVLIEAWKLQPEDEDIRSEIERLVAMTGDYPELGELYNEVLDAHPDMLGRREVVARLAELSDTHLDDPRAALTRYQELHQMDPTDSEPIDALLRLSLLLGDWEARQKALLAKAEAVFDEQERAQVLARLGELRSLTLGDEEGAVEAYERAFEADEGNPQINDRLIALYEGRDEPGRLVDLLIARVEGGQASEDMQFALLTRAAELLEKSISDPQRAIECLGQALTVRPGDAQTISELNRLYRSEEMWGDLLDNLRLEAGTAESSHQRLEVRHEIATILADKMESFEEALEAYGVILDERPDDEVALDAIFKIVESEGHLVRQAADILVPALRQTNLRKRLVKALTLRLSDEQEPHQRVETLRTIAQVQEDDLQDLNAAFESLLKAIKEMPEATDLYEEVERVASAVDGWARYAEVLHAAAKEVFEAEVASVMWVRLAVIYEEKLGKKEEAVEAYQAAAEQVGDRLDLLDALDRLYSELGDTAAVVELLERRMLLADTDEEHSRMLVRQGQLQLDKQKNPEQALSTFRSALERNLHNTDASDQLSRLLEKDEFFEEAFGILDGVFRDRPSGADLAKLHERRVQRASSPEERLDMRRGLAEVLEQECSDPLAAQKTLQQGLTDDIRDEGLRDEIERLLPITGAWTEGAQALLDAVDATSDIDPESARELCQRAADWMRDKAGDSEGAEKALLKAHAFDPTSDEILEQIEALQLGEGREEALLSTLRKRAKLAVDEGTKIEFLRRCHTLAEGLSKHEVAEEVLREILESDPDDLEALEGLSHVRRAAGDYQETYELLNRRIDMESDPDKLRVLKFDSATIARDKLDLLEESIMIFEALYDEAPEDREAGAGLREAYLKAGRFEELGGLISKLMATSTEPGEQQDLKVALARLRQEQFGDTEQAVELLEEVFSANPMHPEAATALADVYEAASRHEQLANLLGRQATIASDQGDEAQALEILRRQADLYEKTLGDEEGAIGVYMKIREKEDTLEVLETILRLQLSSGKKAEAAASLEEICDSLDGGDRIKRRGELADLYRSIGDVDAVIRTVEGTLALDPEDSALRATLRKEYEGAGAWQQVADMILGDAEKAQATATKIDLYREAAQIHMERRKDPPAGADILKKAADLAPEDRDLLLDLCDAYSASGRGSDAVSVLEQIVESYGGKRSKELGEIHRRLATAYLSQGEQEKALDELDKAFRIEPGNVNVLKQLGDTALNIGDLKKAEKMFRALLLQRLDSKSPITKAEVFCRLGQVHQQSGDKPKAKQMFERALQTDGELEAAKEGLASL